MRRIRLTMHGSRLLQHGFRGASPGIFSRFSQLVGPTVREVVLCQNYRSSGSIVHAAASVIENNQPHRRSKPLRTNNPVGSALVLCRARTIECEAAHVAESIMQLVSTTSYSYSDIAILQRVRSVSSIFCQTLQSCGVPYTCAFHSVPLPPSSPTGSQAKYLTRGSLSVQTAHHQSRAAGQEG